MTAAILIVAAFALAALFVFVLVQMADNPFWWMLHFCGNTLANVGCACVWCLAGAYHAITGND